MGLLSYAYKAWKASKKTAPTISSVKPNIPTTKLEKTTSKLNIAKHKTKMSKAKLNQTLFDIDQASKKGGRVERKFGGGADKELSPKQMKIASLAGNKKKIDGPDFKKLQKMKKS